MSKRSFEKETFHAFHVLKGELKVSKGSYLLFKDTFIRSFAFFYTRLSQIFAPPGGGRAGKTPDLSKVAASDPKARNRTLSPDHRATERAFSNE
jgi:hypothetical protein